MGNEEAASKGLRAQRHARRHRSEPWPAIPPSLLLSRPRASVLWPLVCVSAPSIGYTSLLARCVPSDPACSQRWWASQSVPGLESLSPRSRHRGAFIISAAGGETSQAQAPLLPFHCVLGAWSGPSVAISNNATPAPSPSPSRAATWSTVRASSSPLMPVAPNSTALSSSRIPQFSSRKSLRVPSTSSALPEFINRQSRSNSTPNVFRSNQLNESSSCSATSDDAVAPVAPKPTLPPRAVSYGAPRVMTSIAELPTQPLTSSQVTTARQSQTDNIRVLLRIRPTSELETASRRCVELSADGKSIALAPSSLQEKRFTFDQVFGDRSTQDDIFQDAGRMAVDNAINGYNGSIFAYGQTGSGKTFTMMGGVSDSHELRVSPLRGLMPRIFDYMFLRLDEMAAEKGNAFEYACSCSYLEIYNEKIYDLLDESAVAQAKSLREDRNKEVYVEQLRDVSITSEQDAIELLQVGSKNRRIASTDMNRESSRSHAVFTLKLVQTEQSPGGVVTRRRSNLHLVDLAGSEKQRQTNVAGQRLKEAAQINKSLSALGNVIMSLVDVSNGLRRHVHYRDSKLTFLLRDSLGGNAISTMVATISAEEKYFSETLSTLKFAQRAKFIKNNAIQNQDSDSLVPLLKLEIAELRERIQELTLLNANAVAHGPQPTPEFLSPVKHTPEIVRKNRWEPALDIMVKLLRASGAASPADFDDDDQKANCEPVDVRCSRLEMLLYRIICRFEEQKVIAYSPQRFPGYTLGPPSIPKPPSFLPAPKTRYRLKLSENQADHQPLADQHVSTHVKHDRHYTDLEMIHQREQELELENEMLRWQVRDLLAWKTANEKQNSESSQSHHCQCGDADRGSFTSTTTASCSETSVSKGNSLNGNRSLSQLVEDEMDKESLVLPSDTTIELLDAYRGMFENLCELIEEKKSILTPPCSPAASGSSHSSASDAGDDDCASQNDSDDDDSSDDGVDIAREVRRVQEFALKMEGRMDEYQDAIQRLEKDVVNAHDELETATAATKFAEFQLQQLRETTAEDEKRRTELESKVEKLESLCQQHEAHASKMQEELDLVKSQLSESCSSLEKLQQEHAELLSARQEERKSEGSRIDEEQCAMLRKTLLAAQSRMQQMEDELKNASVLARQSLTLSSPPLGSPSRSNASERADEEQHELKKSLATAEARIEELEEKLRVAVEAQPSTTSPRVHAQVAVSGVDSCSVVISQETSEKRESSTSGGLLSVISAPLLNYFSPTTTTTAPAPALPPLPVLEPSPAQSLLDAALADNAELLETVRRLQSDKTQLLSRASMDDDRASEVKRLRAENEGLKRQLSDKRSVLQVPLDSIAKQNDEIKRLAAERVALNSRLQLTQQKMRNLEEELNRSRSVHAAAATRSITSEFFCGI